MDYKKLIKSRAVRVHMMRLLSFVPDKWMVRLQYRIKTGRKLDLKHPKRYTEKLQVYKLNYRDPLMKKCVDKYDVREYVESAGLGHILNPVYGVYDRAEDIKWENLPQQFVAKDTLGGGGNEVFICPDKSKLDKEQFYQTISGWTKKVSGKHPGREWVYDDIPHRIVIERFIPSDPKEGGLIDYKFFVFQGKVQYLYIIADRDLGKGAGLGVFNKDFERLNVERQDEQPLTYPVAKPKHFEEMIAHAEKLAKKFPHARVDLYYPEEQIVFGEITFFDGSGYMTFKPDSFDFKLGEQFEISRI